MFKHLLFTGSITRPGFSQQRIKRQEEVYFSMVLLKAAWALWERLSTSFKTTTTHTNVLEEKRHTFESMVTWGINLFVLCNFFDYFLNDNAIVHTNITWSQINVIVAGYNCNFYGFVAWCLKKKKNRRSLQKILWIPCAPNESITKTIKMTTGADSESNILFQHHFQRSLSNKHWFWFSFQLQKVHRREHEEYYHSQPSKWER